MNCELFHILWDVKFVHHGEHVTFIGVIDLVAISVSEDRKENIDGFPRYWYNAIVRF